MARRDSKTGGPSFRMELDSSSSSSSSSSSCENSSFTEGDSSFTSNKSSSSFLSPILPLGTSSLPLNNNNHNNSNSNSSTSSLIKHTKKLEVGDGFISPPPKFALSENNSIERGGRSSSNSNSNSNTSEESDAEAYNNLILSPEYKFNQLNDRNFYLPANCWNKLYAHQKTGVKWLANKNLEVSILF